LYTKRNLLQINLTELILHFSLKLNVSKWRFLALTKFTDFTTFHPLFSLLSFVFVLFPLLINQNSFPQLLSNFLNCTVDFEKIYKLGLVGNSRRNKHEQNANIKLLKQFLIKWHKLQKVMAVFSHKIRKSLRVFIGVLTNLTSTLSGGPRLNNLEEPN
jgi:hypothetical protein